MPLETPLLQNTSTYIQLARFFVTFIIGTALTKLVLMPASKRIIGRRGDKKAKHSIENLTGVLGLFLTFTVALQAGNFGNLATIIGAMAAALTVAVGFGMRDQVASVVGGIFIHLDNPFIKGDYIKTGDYEGVVKEIKLRATTLNGSSSEKLVVPNSTLVTNPVKNFTKGNRTKTSLEISLNLLKQEKHAELLKEAANNEVEVLADPEPKIMLKGLEDGKFNAELHYWLRDSGDVKSVRSRVLNSYIDRAIEEGLIKEEENE
jgi:potassium efflux system protein